MLLDDVNSGHKPSDTHKVVIMLRQQKFTWQLDFRGFQGKVCQKSAFFFDQKTSGRISLHSTPCERGKYGYTHCNIVFERFSRILIHFFSFEIKVCSFIFFDCEKSKSFLNSSFISLKTGSWYVASALLLSKNTCLDQSKLLSKYSLHCQTFRSG